MSSVTEWVLVRDEVDRTERYSAAAADESDQPYGFLYLKSGTAWGLITRVSPGWIDS